MAHTRKKQARQQGASKAVDALEAEAGKFLAHYQRKEFNQAMAMAEMLTKRFPGELFGWKALGTCLLEMGEPDNAISPLQRALSIAPEDLESNTNIAKALNKLGRYDEAFQYVKNALYIDPHNYQANMWMAEIHSARDEHSLAIQHLETSIEATPDSVVSRLRYATELVNKREYGNALRILEELVIRFPGHPSVSGNLANLYGTMGRFTEAEQQYRKTIELVPKNALAFSNYYFTAHYNPAHDAQSLHELALEWAQRYSPEPRPSRSETDRRANRQLRIGMISSGLRTHPVGQMITAVLENVSRHEISFHAYSDKLATDAIAQRIKQTVSGWHDIGHLNDDALAALIRNDRIDILIDMTGHTAGNRLMAIAKEPAPLIIKWVGGLYNTTGLPAIDYLISDSVETPDGADALYLEKLIRMPDDYICYMKPASAPEPSAVLPAHNNGYITFGCFNNPAKINEPLLKEWAILMRQLPDSRLFLKGGQYTNEAYCDNIASIMERHGVSRDRILMEGPASHRGLMQAYDRMDIALDPWPYSGGLSTCEALLMGVPVVTLPGPTFAGRHSATHLVNAGLPELVTDTWDEYRARAVELATDLESLATIRTHLRDVLLQSPVCDGPRFAKNFSIAMRAIWQRYCEGKAPAALTLNQEGEARFEDEAQPVVLVDPGVFQDGQGQFSWQLKSKIIAVDHGGRLIKRTVTNQLLRLKTLELIVFDPCSHALKSPLNKMDGVHYYPQSMLGNGEPATLYVCLDPAMNATLKPLAGKDFPVETAKGALILTQLPVNTLRLDKIEGVPSVDWLVLDARNDSGEILKYGSKTLKDILLIQAEVFFQPSHEQQPSLAQVSQWASAHGFRFYRFNESQYRSHLPRQDNLQQHQASELVSADALFIPTGERMDALSDNQRMKLAFLLHTIYGIKDLTYELLKHVDSEKADSYLRSQGFISAPKTAAIAEPARIPARVPEVQKSKAPDNKATVVMPKTFAVPDKPRMSKNEAALFLKAITQASQYFEFGSGGSTVWAVQQGLTVHGVESDERWVNALKAKLGERCQVKTVDIGPTREWGYPVSNAHRDKYPLYSQAVNSHDIAFDLILVDGRFRVACTLTAIKHILKHHDKPDVARIFIHDFWDRPGYHTVLQFLDSVESAETAGLFKVKPDIDLVQLEQILGQYMGEAS